MEAPRRPGDQRSPGAVAGLAPNAIATPLREREVDCGGGGQSLDEFRDLTSCRAGHRLHVEAVWLERVRAHVTVGQGW